MANPRLGTTTNTNIQLESLSKFNSRGDIDSIRDTYKDIRTSIEFPDLSIPLLELNMDYLLLNSARVQMIPRWYYRPAYMSYDVYGTTNYYYILPYVNNIFTYSEFKRDELYVPLLSAIRKVFSQNDNYDRTLVHKVQYTQ